MHDSLHTLYHLPIQPKTLLLFLTSLYEQGKKYSTIMTYVSAISFAHKVRGLSDPANHAIIQKLLQGIKNLSLPTQTLQPITKNILVSLLANVPFVSDNQFERVLIRALFSVMYYACLRIGEVAKSSHMQNIIQINQISFTPNGDNLVITFYHYKHSNGKSPTLTLTRHSTPECPVAALSSYLVLRGKRPGPLFLLENGSPVSRMWLVRQLKLALQMANLNPLLYNSHSFRIGRCTQLVMDGYPDSFIRKVGRWASNAYLRYVRPTTLCPNS